MLSPRSGRAQYQQLADLLRDRLDQGVYPAGTRLPTEGALCDEFMVGRMTVRRALAVLREEGRILTQRGEPTLVRSRTTRREVALQAQDRVTVRMPSAPERAVLHMKPGVPLLEVRRVGGVLDVFAADEAELVVCPE